MAEKNNSGFIKVPYELIEKLSSRELHVFCALAYYDSMKDGATPSFGTIAKKIGKHRTRVIEVVESLIKKRVIGVQKRHRAESKSYTSNKYILLTTRGGSENATRGGSENATLIRVNLNKSELNKREREEKTPLVAADLSLFSSNLNHPESEKEVIELARSKGVDISLEQAQDFISRYEVIAINGTWVTGKNNPVRDWRKLMNLRWITNWKRDNEKNEDDETPAAFKRIDAKRGNYRSFTNDPNAFDQTLDGSNF